MRCRAVTLAVLSLVPIGLHLARYDSVVKLQSKATAVTDQDFNFYDTDCGGEVLKDALEVYLGIRTVSKYATIG